MSFPSIGRFGRVGIPVLNASARKEARFTEMTFEKWRTVMSISLDGSFHCNKACLPSMCGPGAGFITGQTVHVNGGMLMAS